MGFMFIIIDIMTKKRKAGRVYKTHARLNAFNAPILEKKWRSVVWHSSEICFIESFLLVVSNLFLLPTTMEAYPAHIQPDFLQYFHTSVCKY